MSKFEKFLMALGGIALVIIFAFPQVIIGFFIFAVVVIIAQLIFETIDDKRNKHKSTGN